MHKKITAMMVAAAMAVAAPSVFADILPDTWVGMDELGRIVPTSDNMDGGRATLDSKVQIGMFYYVWHGTEGTMKPVYDNTEILNASTTNPQWGPFGAYHWGNKPWYGYYDAGNKSIIYRHIQMLCDAGVDFVVFDCSNGPAYPDQISAFIDVVRIRQQKGLPWPKLSFLVYNNQSQAIKVLWSRFYSMPEYSDLWFRWQGNPLLLCDAAKARADASLAHIIPYLNLRHSWAWQGGKENTWSWLDYYPQGVGYTRTDGKTVPECISVGAAQHPTTNIGKSYCNGKAGTIDAKGLTKDTAKGLYFAEQWKRAKSLSDAQRPPVVFVTQWNEHIAMRFRTGDSNGADPGKVRPGGKKGDSNESYFVDVYNAEYSRDLEPTTHPLIRDNYYMQLCEEIRKYRGTRTIPTPTNNVIINIDGPWEQWDKVKLTFEDDNSDNLYQPLAHLTVDKERLNDILTCKVTKDNDKMHFYVAARSAIKFKGDRCMRLLLNTDCNYTTGWQGYDYMLRSDENGNYKLYKNSATGSFSWTETAAVPSRCEDKELMLSVTKSQLGITGNKDIDFKWVDNVALEEDSDPMLFYSDGDVAPNGRFNYRYKGSKCTKTPIQGSEGSGIGEVRILPSEGTNVNASDVKIYPNPTSGMLHITAPAEFNRLDFFAMDGRLLRSMQFDKTDKKDVNLATFAPGRYLMCISPLQVTLQVIVK